MDSLVSYGCNRPRGDFVPTGGSGFDCGPEETVPSPFKGLSAYTELSVLPVSLVSCLTPATARQLENKDRSLGWYALIIHLCKA